MQQVQPGYTFIIPKEKFLPIYQPLVLDPEVFDIDFLYGGRDSGKSRHIAMQLIAECLAMPYFKCLLIRKIQNTVRISQYDLIKTILELWKIDHFFTFNSTRLEIICKINGNGFYGRGLDNPTGIKSFNNPNRAWVEEGNQIEADDMVILLTTLRSNDSMVKTYFSFNPECEVNYTDFWLWQDWFSHTTQLNFKWTRTIDTPEGPVDIKVRATHSTYKNNPYCSPQRMALYESYKNSKNNAYWYLVYTLGQWGYRKPEGRFYKCFEESVHTMDLWSIPQIKNGNFTFHIGADNNVAPYVAVQIWIVDLKGKALLQVAELPCVSPNNTATKAAKEVLEFLYRHNYRDTVYIYGDPSANAKSTTDDEGRSFFDKFIGTIKAGDYNYVDRVGKSAPSVSQSGSFINEIYEHNFDGWKIFIDNSCLKSVEDYNMTVEDAGGGMLKKKVIDKLTKKSYEKWGHFSDIKRYFVTTVLKEEYQAYLTRRKGYPVSGGMARAKRSKQKLG